MAIIVLRGLIEMAGQRLILLAESQLFKTQNQSVAVKQFAETTIYPESYIKWVLFYDMFLAPYNCATHPDHKRSYINDYKIGKINDQQFYDGLRYRLGKTEEQLSNDQIKRCWNSMCEFSEQANQECRDFVEFLKDNTNYRIVFVNETNRLQHDFNVDSFKVAIGEEAPGTIIYANSHIEQIMGKQALAKHTISRWQDDNYRVFIDDNSRRMIADNQDIEAVISLHRDIKPEGVLNEGKQTQFHANRVYMSVATNAQTNIPEAIKAAHQQVEQQLEPKKER